MEKAGLTPNEIISALAKSPHGKLEEYLPVGRRAAVEQPDFLAHLIAWNARKGQIRDAKVALPLMALTARSLYKDFRENALAHLASLDPRNLLRGLRFAKGVGVFQNGHGMKSMVRQYLRSREANWGWWQRTAVQYRQALKELYVLFDVHPAPVPREILFLNQYPAGSVFEKVKLLPSLPPVEAAGVIITEKIPFLVAIGALGANASNETLVMALIDRMSASELVNNSKMLEKLGMKTSPVLRSAYAAALKRAETSKANTLKSAKAIEKVSDPGLKAQLTAMQEKQIQGVSAQGDWLVLVDKSGSMRQAIELGRKVAAVIAKMAAGSVHLVFFDVMPYYHNVTGKTYEEIKELTRRVMAQGGTSIGCGVRFAIDKKLDVDGIAIISDGGDNTSPLFCGEYEKLVKEAGKEPPVYLYRVNGDDNSLSRSAASAGIDIQVFDMTGSSVDEYSLPNLVQTMRTNRYSLVQEIMDTPLLTLEKVYGRKISIEQPESEAVNA